MTKSPVAYAAVAMDASESTYVTTSREQAEAACREHGWQLLPLYTAAPGSWQRVSDNGRFPEDGVEVLVFADGRRCNAERWRGEWWHACQGFEKRGGRMLKRVSHWMLLPAPPTDAK